VFGVRGQGPDGEEQDAGVGEGSGIGEFVGWGGRGRRGRGRENTLPVVGCGFCEVGVWRRHGFWDGDSAFWGW